MQYRERLLDGLLDGELQLRPLNPINAMMHHNMWRLRFWIDICPRKILRKILSYQILLKTKLLGKGKSEKKETSW